jgi:hypothetical protein
MFGAAWLVSFISVRRSAAEEKNASEDDESESVYDPTVLGSEVFADSSQHRRDGAGQTDSSLSLFIVRIVERCVDNAVLTRDLRARLRNRISAPKVAYLFAAMLAVTFIICKWLPFLAAPGSGIADGIYGALPKYQALTNGSPLQSLANIQGCFYIVLAISAFFCAYGVLPRAFGTDKRKNTLSFLLTTPMSAWSIVSGKAFALALTCGAAFWFCAIVSLLICFPMTLVSGGFNGFGWWAAICGSAFLGYVATAMIMLALGSLFPDITAVRLNGCIRLVVIWFVYMVISAIVGGLSLIADYYHVPPGAIWAVCVAAAIAVIVFCIMITIGAVTGMRKGDIDIKLAKR